MSSELKANKISPATGTTTTLGDSGDTFDIPSGATLDVTGATVSGLSAGKILQYVTTEGYSGAISVDNNTTPASAGSTFLVSITPSATTSKILIQFGSSSGGTQANSYAGLAKLYRQIASGSYSSINTESLININTQASHRMPWGSSYTDSPSTTSACNYQLYVYTAGNNVAYFTESDSYRFIRAWEIAA